MHRCRDLDSELNSTHQKLVKLEQQHVMLTQTIRTELDVLVETGETTSEHKYSDGIVGSGGSDLLTDITVCIITFTQSVCSYHTSVHALVTTTVGVLNILCRITDHMQKQYKHYDQNIIL